MSDENKMVNILLSERIKANTERISELEKNHKLIEDYLGLNKPLSKNKDVKQEIMVLREKIEANRVSGEQLEKKMKYYRKVRKQLNELREEQKAFIEVCQEPCKDCKLNELVDILKKWGLKE